MVNVENDCSVEYSGKPCLRSMLHPGQSLMCIDGCGRIQRANHWLVLNTPLIRPVLHETRSTWPPFRQSMSKMPRKSLCVFHQLHIEIMGRYQKRSIRNLHFCAPAVSPPLHPRIANRRIATEKRTENRGSEIRKQRHQRNQRMTEG